MLRISNVLRNELLPSIEGARVAKVSDHFLYQCIHIAQDATTCFK